MFSLKKHVLLPAGLYKEPATPEAKGLSRHTQSVRGRSRTQASCLLVQSPGHSRKTVRRDINPLAPVSFVSSPYKLMSKNKKRWFNFPGLLVFHLWTVFTAKVMGTMFHLNWFPFCKATSIYFQDRKAGPLWPLCGVLHGKLTWWEPHNTPACPGFIMEVLDHY